MYDLAHMLDQISLELCLICNFSFERFLEV